MMKALTALFLTLAVSSASGAATITALGQSNYQIVTPDKKSPVINYAAHELQYFMRKITGVILPIVPESRAGDSPAFLIGPCKRVQEAHLDEQAAKLKEDGVLIKTIGSDIALLGQNERGQIYSVYVLLEKFLGVRFLAWDCNVVPKQRELNLPELDYTYSPPFMYRETLYFNSFPKEIAARQRLNGPFTKCDASVGGKMEFFPYVHSFDDLIPPEEYFEKHPEYFSLLNGKRVALHVHSQLCLTNPDVLRIAKEKVMKWIEEHPDVPIIDVSQNDGEGACECDSCKAVVAEEGSQHGPIMRFVNAIADEVAKKYPDKWVETLAYAYAIKPPSITKPRPNVIIRLCHSGCFFHGFEQCSLGSNYPTYLQQWSHLTNRIFIWHYATNFAHYLAPDQNLAALAKDIKYYGSHGVNGVMVQCNYQGPGGELAELRQYLAAQLLWDPSQDPAKIREEFCKGYYGPAADDVMKFLALMDKAAEDPNVHAFAAWDPRKTVTPEFVNDALHILHKARAKASIGSRVIVNRIDKLMLPIWYMQLSFPDVYALPESNAAPLWKETKRVMIANKITHVRETGGASEWIAEMDARFTPLPKNVVFSLLDTGRVKLENCADWRLSTVDKNGQTLRTIFHHPYDTNNADATYEIKLPQLQKGKRLWFKFGTVITSATEDGVRFSVLVNGEELWTKTQTSYLSSEEKTAKSAHDNIMPTEDPFTDNAIDLSAYANQTIKLTLRVNAINNSEHDWANWVQPRIVIE